MKQTRFWVGIGVLTTACVLLILVAAPGYHIIRYSGRVDGRITYNGRPLQGGVVLFVPDDRERFDMSFAQIDRTGHYETDKDWRREGPGRTRFRICVVPDAHIYPRVPSPSMEGQVLPPEGSKRYRGLAMPAAVDAGGSDALPMRGSTQSPSWARGLGGPPARYYSPTTSDLAVELGNEPARIDIDLAD